MSEQRDGFQATLESLRVGREIENLEWRALEAAVKYRDEVRYWQNTVALEFAHLYYSHHEVEANVALIEAVDALIAAREKMEKFGDGTGTLAWEQLNK